MLITKISDNKDDNFDLESHVSVAKTHNFPDILRQHFKSDEAILDYLCEQDYAFNHLKEESFCKSMIQLTYEKNDLQPLKVNHFKSRWIHKHFGKVDVFAFLMPEITFKSLSEEIL